jgi:hypothetical protein
MADKMTASQRRALESEIVAAILAYLKSLPCTKAYKLHGSIYLGKAPDIIGCTHGRMFVIEAKVPGQEPDPGQAAELRHWAAAGALAFCAHGVEEVKDAFLSWGQG